MSNGEIRAVPPAVFQKWRVWRSSAMGWKTAHYLAGFVSAVLATIIAINTKTFFFDNTATLVMASLAAGLSFLVTTMGAQERANTLERAPRSSRLPWLFTEPMTRCRCQSLAKPRREEWTF